MKTVIRTAGTALAMALAVSGANAQGSGTHGVYTVSAMAGGAMGQKADNVKDDLFAGTEIFEKNAVDVTEISMDPDSLDMVKGHDGQRAHSMVLNVVRTYSYDKPGMYNMADVDQFRNKLNSGEWHCSVHERNLKSGSSTDICQKRRSDGMKESAIITVEPKELTFIHQIKRADGGGSSSIGYSPLGPVGYYSTIGGYPMLAELNADGIAMMAEQRAMMAEQAARMKADIHAAMPGFNYEDFQKGFEKINTPEMQKQFKDMNKSFEKFNSPEMKMHFDEMNRSVEKMKSDKAQKDRRDAEKPKGVEKDKADKNIQ